MKKKNLKKFVLKKRTISNLESGELKGGTRTSNLCTNYCSLQCTPTASEGCFTQNDNSECVCL